MRYRAIRRVLSAVVPGVLAVAVAACAVPASAPAAPSVSRVARITPAEAALLAEVTAIPVKTSDFAFATMPDAQLTRQAAQPLTMGGKPEVLYVGTQYCPYCAAENWALLVALGRFGLFSDVSEIRSGSYPPYPPLDSWTFYGSSYRSKYLTFVPVEMYSNILVRPAADPKRAESYRVLQKLSVAQRALMKKADKEGATPFTDFGGQAVMTGSPVSASWLEHLTWSQIASALRARRGMAAQAVIGAADYITAELCRLTGNRPTTACPASFKDLLTP